MDYNRRRESTRIVFMGTPEFAVASLDALVQAGFNIVAVITAPDKPAGRGMKISASSVKQYALEKHIPVLQPERLKNASFVEELKSFNADLQVVVAFRMLPEVIWSMPAMGTINVHASLLPKYRGAAPINWAIINGENETGVTTFKLVQEIDTGNILLQESVPIGDDDTAGDLHDKLKNVGAQLLIKTIEGLLQRTITEQPQALMQGVTHAPKIFTDTCRIDWTKGVDQVHNLVRGLAPFPGAFTELNGKQLKIYRSRKQKEGTEAAPGSFATDNRTFLRYFAADGYLDILELQIEGKKKLPVADFLRGFRP